MADSSSGKRKLFLSIVLIAVLIGSGTGIAALLYATRPQPPQRDLASLPPVVETIVVQPEDVSEQFVGYATAKPDRSANLAAEVLTTVIERVNHIETGDHVSQGQVLFRFDDRSYRQALAQAEALVAADQASLDELQAEAETLDQLIHSTRQELTIAANEKARLADLFERNMAAKKEYDFAKLSYQQSRRVLQEYEGRQAKIKPQRAGVLASRQSHEAAVDRARLDVERCELRAPFEGAVDEVYVEVGDHVAPGTVALRLIDAAHVKIPIRLPSNVYSRMKRGAHCRVESGGMAGITWEGRVTRIAPSVDEQTRTFAVYVQVDNTAQAFPLRPGTFVRATVAGATYMNRLLVPRGAVRDRHVMVVGPDRKVRRRLVKVERFLKDRALVGGDLRPGDRVILSHLSQLRDGSPVRLRTAMTGSSPTPTMTQPVTVDSSP